MCRGGEHCRGGLVGMYLEAIPIIRALGKQSPEVEESTAKE
jgi:hypothetical protein